MTILEQPIDPDQIQLTLHPIAMICTCFAIIIVLAFSGYKYVCKAGNRRAKGKMSDGALYIRAFLTILVIMFGSVFSIAPINTYAHKVPGLNHFSQPLSNSTALFSGNKQLFADAYRDEINAAVADKLGDYDMPECAIDKKLKSLLCPDSEYQDNRRIAAIRDGKTYTLVPHLNYNVDTSTATLNVDVEEGYHP